jgi:hypothetical protein
MSKGKILCGIGLGVAILAATLGNIPINPKSLTLSELYYSLSSDQRAPMALKQMAKEQKEINLKPKVWLLTNPPQILN